MCQAYEGEREYLVHRDLQKIREQYEAHKRGDKKLSNEELFKLALEKLILEDR